MLVSAWLGGVVAKRYFLGVLDHTGTTPLRQTSRLGGRASTCPG